MHNDCFTLLKLKIPISKQSNIMTETCFKTGMFRKISSIRCRIWGGMLIRAGEFITANTVFYVQDKQHTTVVKN